MIAEVQKVVRGFTESLEDQQSHRRPVRSCPEACAWRPPNERLENRKGKEFKHQKVGSANTCSECVDITVGASPDNVKKKKETRVMPVCQRATSFIQLVAPRSQAQSDAT